MLSKDESTEASFFGVYDGHGGKMICLLWEMNKW
jgi:serine/threonine protein phosphatase PrpC